MSTYGIHLLRWSIAIIYLWFGMLKLFKRQPCRPVGGSHGVLAATAAAALLFVGVWEVLIGLGLLFPYPLTLRLTLFLLWLQIAALSRYFFCFRKSLFKAATLCCRRWKGSSRSKTWYSSLQDW